MAKTLPGAPAGLNETQPLPTNRPVAEDSKQSGDHRFERVQARAYKLWEDAGRPRGGAEREHFWREAENQLDQGSKIT
jgi:hypothetical protein